MSLELEGEVKDASVNVGNGAIQIGRVSTGRDGVSIVSSSSKEGHSQIQGESIEAGGRVRIETRGGSTKGRVVFGNIKCSGRVTIIAGGGSESESDSDDDDAVVVVEKEKKENKRAREEEEEDEEDDDEEEEEEDEDDDIDIEEESDSEDEEKEDEKKKKTNKKAKGKTTTREKEVINLDN
jgi:TATA-binding protein-associated factor Taf7